jgi:HK97 family phage prohead protease
MTLISGYASVFNILDQDRDIIIKGAFANQNKKIDLFWQHNLKQKIGTVEKLIEDNMGLFIVAKLFNKNQLAQKAQSLIRDNLVTGLSIGFKPIKTTSNHFRKTRIIQSLELFEISVVDKPANQLSLINQLY